VTNKSLRRAVISGLLKPAEPASFEHCQGDNVTLGATYIADWFSDKLGASRRT
jgi:hypothetical protein